MYEKEKNKEKLPMETTRKTQKGRDGRKFVIKCALGKEGGRELTLGFCLSRQFSVQLS